MHALPRSLLRRGAALLLCVPLAAVANPTGGTVAAGAATISHAGSTTTITQGTDRVVINWNDFNVGAGERTQFLQPGAQSAVLNRVTGGNPTQIFGRLEGNGRVFVLNPNGVLVGAGGVVQTQGFIGSTLNVADREFMAGGNLRFAGDSTATVANLGRIDAGAGDAVLIAQRVRNAGDIAAGGTAGLAAGNEVLLAREGDTRIWVKSGVTGAGGTGVDQSGTVNAVQAELKAAGGNVYSLAVNSSGLVSATGVTERDGRIYLTSDGGNVEVSGTLQARGAAGKGGEIYVGGGYQGKDAGIANAGATTVTAAAKLDAGGDADRGGKIVVWSDGATRNAGAAQTGRGGEVEISGKGTLDLTGAVNTRGGHLLLDPTDITIDNSNFATLIGNPLLTGAVTISASNDITYNTSNPIQSNYTLVWDAGRDVVFAPTSAFGSMGAGNNVDFQVYAGRDFIMNAASSVQFSGDGKALIRAGRDIAMGGSATISFGSGGWVLLSADTANSSRPDHGAGKITLDTTAYLAATKIQAFAPSPSQFINNSMVSFATPTYDTWEGDFSVSSTGSGLWFKSGASGTFGPPSSPLLITANDFVRSWGDPNPDFTARFTGLVNGDTASAITGLQFSTSATISSRVATYTITPFGATAPSYYSVSYAPGTLSIVPALLTVTANNASRLYGDANGPLGVTITGFKLGQTTLDVQPHAFNDTPVTAGVGNYPITVTRGDSDHYTFQYVPGVLSVLPAPLVIKANDATRMQGAENVFSATYTGFRNGDTPAVVSNLLFNSPATPSSGEGSYAITPFGAKAANYGISYLPGTLTVTAPVVVISNTTSVTGNTGVAGSWSDSQLVQTMNEAQIAGVALMNSSISTRLQQIDQSKATVMAESVQALLVEAELVKSNGWNSASAVNAVNRLLLYMQQNWGMSPDVTNYADFVHDLFPTWLPQLRQLALTDPELAGWLAKVDAEAKGMLSFIPGDLSADDLIAIMYTKAAQRVAYGYRSADEKAIGTAAQNYVATRQKELAARMASLEAQIKAQVTAEDPAFPHTRLDTLFQNVRNEDGTIAGTTGRAYNEGAVYFETNSTVSQKWTEYYTLKYEADGYQKVVAGKSMSGMTQSGNPDPMIFVLKNLLDQGKIQIF